MDNEQMDRIEEKLDRVISFFEREAPKIIPRIDSSICGITRDWIDKTYGYFTLRQLFKENGVTERNDKKNIYELLHRLCKQGIIERKEGQGRYYHQTPV